MKSETGTSEAERISDSMIGTRASEDPFARKRRLMVLVGVAIGAVLIIGVAIAGVMSSGPSPTPVASGSATSSASSAPVVASVSAPPSVTPAPQEIAASFRADPPEARFSVDDGGVLTNPFNGKFPRDNAKHFVKGFAPGYATKVQEVTFDDDLSVQMSLARDTGKKKH